MTFLGCFRKKHFLFILISILSISTLAHACVLLGGWAYIYIYMYIYVSHMRIACFNLRCWYLEAKVTHQYMYTFVSVSNSILRMFTSTVTVARVRSQ
jgi:hypothetical protein